jgi:hypothetical protein
VAMMARRFIGHFVLLLGRAPNASSSANHVLLFDPSSGPEGGKLCSEMYCIHFMDEFMRNHLHII